MFSKPTDFITNIVRGVIERESGLTAFELEELGVNCAAEFDTQRDATRIRIAWNNGDGTIMRQLDFFLEVSVHNATKESEMVAAFARQAVEQAHLRGELQFHRLEKRLPKRIKEVFIGPVYHMGQMVPAGSMIIVFKSGATLVCTELETLADEFVAKCLMVT